MEGEKRYFILEPKHTEYTYRVNTEAMIVAYTFPMSPGLVYSQIGSRFSEKYDANYVTSYKTLEELQEGIKAAKPGDFLYGYKSVREYTKETLPTQYWVNNENSIFEMHGVEIERKIGEGVTDEMVEKFTEYPHIICGDAPMPEIPPDTKIRWRENRICLRCEKPYPMKDHSSYFSSTCPICGNKSDVTMRTTAYDHFLKTENRKSYGVSYMTKSYKTVLYLASLNGSELRLDGIEMSVRQGKDKIIISYNKKCSFAYEPGKINSSVRYVRNKEEKASLFDILGLNSQKIWNIPNMIYRGYEDFEEFFAKNTEFFKRTGFLSLMTYKSEITVVSAEAMFFVYMSALNMYPSLEQIVKGNCPYVLNGLYKDFVLAKSKVELQDKMKRTGNLVRPEARNDKDALRVPVHIRDYLGKKAAPIEEWFFWCDFYELTKITNGEFEKLVSSPEFALINTYLDKQFPRLLDILKFGYPPEKLFRYITKTAKKLATQAEGYDAYFPLFMFYEKTVNFLADYLAMCDEEEITPDKYPMDLKKVHDVVSRYYNKKRQEEEKEREKRREEVLCQVAEECRKYILPKPEGEEKANIPKAFSEYDVLFPRCTKDLLEEGNAQHNCVGSYARNILDGNCVVFFIRKKSSPEESFITASTGKPSWEQVMYKNNTPVESKELLSFADHISRKIKAGVKSGKISALGKIPKTTD